MPTQLENLLARRDRILEELAAMDACKPGGRPNASGGTSGEKILDHRGYRESLYSELERINGLIPALDGPWEIVN